MCRNKKKCRALSVFYVGVNSLRGDFETDSYLNPTPAATTVGLRHASTAPVRKLNYNCEMPHLLLSPPRKYLKKNRHGGKNSKNTFTLLSLTSCLHWIASPRATRNFFFLGGRENQSTFIIGPGGFLLSILVRSCRVFVERRRNWQVIPRNKYYIRQLPTFITPFYFEAKINKNICRGKKALFTP